MPKASEAPAVLPEDDNPYELLKKRNPYSYNSAIAMANMLRGQKPSSKPISEQSWDELVQTRKAYEGDQLAQEVIAPQEHLQFSREYVRDQPWSAPGIAAAAPIYAALKAMGIQSGRTPASVDQIMASWTGTVQGLQDYFSKKGK